MKKQLLKKFSVFMVTAMLFSVSANAQIVYTDVIPDTTVSATTGFYNLDLNNDGIADFKILRTYAFSCAAGNCSGYLDNGVKITPFNLNEVADSVNVYPFALNSGADVKNSGYNWASAASQTLEYYHTGRNRGGRFGACTPCGTSTSTGNWKGAIDKYLGLRFTVGSNLYYGWARLNVSSTGASFTIKDYAYNTVPDQNIIAGSITVSTLPLPVVLPHCGGDTISFTYYTVFTFGSNNVFTAQLSDSTGNFSSAVNIGFKTDSVGGTMSVVIPPSTATGAGYRIRIVSSSPATTGPDNGHNLYIRQSGIATAAISATGSPVICPGQTAHLNTSATSGFTYQWLKNSVNIPGANSTTYNTSQGGIYQCAINCGCGTDTSNQIQVINDSVPHVSIDTNGTTSFFCQGEDKPLYALADTTVTFQWKLNGVLIAGATDSIYFATGSGNYTVVATNNYGCYSTSNTILLNAYNQPAPNISTNGTELFINVFVSYQWFVDGNIINGATSQYYTPSASGSYTVVVSDTNSCSGVSNMFHFVVNSIPSFHSSYFKIYPNPATNNLTITLGSSSQKVEVSITDITGKIIYTTTASETQKIDVNTNDYSAGVYAVQIQTADFIETKKLIVEK